MRQHLKLKIPTFKMGDSRRKRFYTGWIKFQKPKNELVETMKNRLCLYAF